MQTIKTIKNQTIWDVAVQYYGTLEAVEELLRLNPALRSDVAQALAAGYVADSSIFYLDLPILEGSSVTIDTDSKWYKRSIVKQIAVDVTTFEI